MSEPSENLDVPVNPEPAELGEAGPWRNVPQPTIEELTTPSVEVIDAPRMPLVVKIIGIALVVALLGLSAWLGLALGSSGKATPSPTPSIDSSLWVMESPTTLGNYVRGDVTSTPAGPKADRDIVTAQYADGNDKIVLLLSRPEDDLATYLEELTVEPVETDESFGEASCGVSVVTELPFCVRVVDDTAIAVGGLNDQGFEQLAPLVDKFYAALR